MAYAEQAQNLLQPLVARTVEAAHTAAHRLPIRRHQPLAVGSPPVEYRIYDPADQRFARSETQLRENLQVKARLLAAGDTSHEEITTALLVGGGAMAGVVSAGMLEEFRDQGLIDVFDAVIGVSAGAANAACVLGSKSEAGVHTYTDTMASKNGLFKHGLWRPGGLNLSYLRTYLSGENGLDIEKIHQARPRLHIGVVDELGQKVIHDVSTLEGPELIERIIISCAAPYVSNDVFAIDGVGHTDGYLGGFPLEEVTRDYDNIVVMANFPQEVLFGDRDYNYAERLWLRRNTRNYPPAVRAMLLESGGRTTRSLLPLLDNTDKNITLLAPSAQYASMTTRNRAALQRGGNDGRSVARAWIEGQAFAHTA